MDKLLHIETVQEMLQRLGAGVARNPMIDIIDMKEATRKDDFDNMRLSFGFFMVAYKRSFCGNILYGQNPYDYSDGTLLFFSPFQSVSVRGLVGNAPDGFLLMFHPELLRGTLLDRQMKTYTFFGYGMNEALHVSASEFAQVADCLRSIDGVLGQCASVGQRQRLSSLLSSLFRLCRNFYGRQFSMRKEHDHDVLSRFEQLLIDYFSAGGTACPGLPTMKYMADRIFLSPNYLGDLIKNATGRSAKETINLFVIEEAKRRLTSSDKPVKDIARSLGFEYPQYFSQMFKRRVGMTPDQYRKSRTDG